MFNKNLILLLGAQIFSFTAGAITIFLSGIIGSSMIVGKSFATLPAALMIIGTALGSIFASYIMSIYGRRFGFMFAAVLTSASSLIASYSVHENLFLLYCVSNFFIGTGLAFVAQYRFAAAESVEKNYIPSAISYILFANMIGALIGPSIATISKDIISNSLYTGSYIFLSILTIAPFFIFIFYTNEEKAIKKENNLYGNRTYLELLFQPKFIQAVVASGLAYCIMSFLMTATPISMHMHNNISIGKTGIVIIFHLVGMFVPSLFTGSLIKRFGHNRIMYSGVIILFFSIIINFVDQNFYNYFFSLILLGLGWNFLFISGSSLLIISYRPEEKFRAQGLNDFMVFGTQAIGALSAGFFLNIFGWKLINLICIPLLIIIILTIYISENRIKSRKKNSNS